MAGQNGFQFGRLFPDGGAFRVVLILLLYLTAALFADDEIRVEGPVQALGSDSLVVSGAVFFVDGQTEIRGPEGDIDWSDLRVGVVVEVRAHLRGDTTFLAERIELRKDVTVEGLIQSIDADSSGTGTLMVNDIRFRINAATEIRGPHGATLAAADLKTGDFVEVRGDLRADHIYLATRVEVADPNDPDEIEVKGFIAAISPDTLQSSITVNNLIFFPDAGTEIRGEHGAILAFSDLQTGDLVEIRARLRTDGTLLALRIERETFRREIEVRGVIESLGPDRLVISGLVFRVDANTRFRDAPGNPLVFNDFQSGDPVKVRAVRQPDHSLLATRVTLRNRQPDEIEWTAPIDTLFNDTIVVGGVRFRVNENTEILDDNRQPIAFADLQIGLIVEIRGLRQADGTILATRIKVEDFFQDEVEVTGMIDSVGGDAIVVLGRPFFVDANTVILDNDNLPIPFSDLAVGMRVQLRAERQADGRLLATRIKIEDAGNDRIELTGRIDSLNIHFIRVDGFDSQVDENTVVLDHANNPIAFGDLTVGMTVEIKVIPRPGTVFPAVRIKIEDRPGFSAISGVATTVTPAAIVIARPTFRVTPQTVVLDEKFRPVPYQSITAGQAVTLWADAAGGQPVALQIKINRSANLTAISAGNGRENQPRGFELGQNYPNPFNPATTIPFTITGAQFRKVRLTIYNILGQQVRTLFNGILDGGSYEFRWDGTNQQGSPLASGVYFYQLRADQHVVATRRMLLLK